MAILFNDTYGGGQQEVELGRSRINPRETYSSSPEGIRSQYSDAVRNVDSLVSSLSSLSRAAGVMEAKQQALIDKQAQVMQDAKSVGYDSQTGGTGGGFMRFFSGAGRPSASALIDIDQRQGSKAFAEALSADKEYQTLMTRTDIWENPDEARKQFAAITERVRKDFESSNPNRSPYFFGGWATAERDARSKADAMSLQQFVTSTQARNADDLKRDAQNDAASGRLPLQERASVIARENGVEPAKVHQIVNVENEAWNPGAQSGTGVRGLTQTSNDRYNEIKARLQKENPELAARMKDRTDPESSLIALTAELPRMEAAAKQILGRDPTTAETYLFWNLGMGGGAQLARAIASGNLNARVGDVVTDKNALNANKPLYGVDGSKTVGEAMGLINARMKDTSPYHARALPVSQMQSVIFTESTGIPEGSTRYNYKWSDFKNSGVQGGAGQLDSRVIQVLDQASQMLGYKIMPTSGHRTGDYQAQRGIASGAHGPHTTGTALDIDIKDPQKQLQLARFFSSMGVKGIGVYGSHMHIDLVNRDASWSKDGAKVSAEQLKEAIAQGKQDAANGGYYRVAGFQGTSMSPFQASINQYNSRYGLGYANTRLALLNAYTNAAENAALTGSPVQAATMLSDILTNYGEGMTGAERNTLLNKQTQVFDLAKKVADQEDTLRQMAADKWERTEMDKLIEAQRNGQTYRPDRNAAPKTLHGEKAAARLEELSLSPVVTPAISNDTARTLQLRLNDPDLYKELGYEDGSKPANVLEFKERIRKQYAGRIGLPELNSLAEKYEEVRKADPAAVKFADNSLAVNRIKIIDAFTNNRDALAQLRLAPGMEGLPTEALIRDYTDRMLVFYRQNYAEMYKQTVANSPLGAELDATARDAIEQKALLNTEAYGRSMANIIMANKGISPEANMNRMAQVQALTDPAAITRQILATNGAPITEAIPGVPPGSRAVGTPSGDGTIQMSTPNGTTFFYNPYFAAAQASPEMRRMVDEREAVTAEPEPAKPNADKPSKDQKIVLPSNASFEEQTKVLEEKSLERSPSLDIMGTLRGIGSAISTAFEQDQAGKREIAAFQKWLVDNKPELAKYSRMDEAARAQYYELWKEKVNKK